MEHFIENHAGQIWAADFFTATTIGFKQLYVFIIMSIKTREVLHWNVTEHPTADWTYQQILHTTWDHKTPKFLIVDRDSKYGGTFNSDMKKHLGIRVIRTPYRAPKANAFCERLIGTLRRDCLDHFILFGEKHLRAILSEFIEHYNHRRPHQGLGQRVPAKETIAPQLPTGTICSRPVLNGLIRDYYRKAA